MKVIVAGSRSITDFKKVWQAIEESGFQISELVSGGARGVDRLAEEWARDKEIPTRIFRPDWKLGAVAGPIRNQQMAVYADALIAIWDGKSRGTQDMIKKSQAKGLRVYIKRYE